MINKYSKALLLIVSLFFTVAIYADTLNSILHKPNDPIAGNPKGKITVVEFFDYQCSHCSNMAPVISSIIQSNPNVRIIFKEYPIRGPMSEFASRAALAANKQHKYYELNHALLTTDMVLSERNIFDIAKSLNINVAKLKKDMNSVSVKNQVAANYELARELNLTGTPAFFVGKTDAANTKNLNFILGEISQSELQDAINNA